MKYKSYASNTEGCIKYYYYYTLATLILPTHCYKKEEAEESYLPTPIILFSSYLGAT